MIKKSPNFAIVVWACLVMASSPWVAAQSPADAKWKPVEDAMGRSGQVQSADVIRFGMPRKDLHVSLGDVTVKAALALGSWTAFLRTGDGTMVMGGSGAHRGRSRAGDAENCSRGESRLRRYTIT
jgi:hypothetical protein